MMKKNILFIVLANGLFVSCVNENLIAQENLTLKKVFADKFLIGVAMKEAQFSGRDTRGASIVVTQFNSISPENALKWDHVHPTLEQYNFEPVDQFVSFGEKNKMYIIGHTLVWHYQTPRSVFEDKNGNPIDRETLLKRLHDHIQTVVGRYKGRIKAWDVVNEALADDGTLRQSPWLKIIGEDFIAQAFQFAHEADPQAELYYNDYSLDFLPKRNGVIALIKKLQSQGVPVTGIGLQGHYKMDWPSISLVDSTLTLFSQLGVKIVITELDLDVLPVPTENYGADITMRAEMKASLNPYIHGLPDSIQRVVTQRYVDLFAVYMKHNLKISTDSRVGSSNYGGVSRVTLWGVTDGDSWLNNWPIRGRTNYPLLFGRDGKPNATFDAIIKLAVKSIENKN